MERIAILLVLVCGCGSGSRVSPGPDIADAGTHATDASTPASDLGKIDNGPPVDSGPSVTDSSVHTDAGSAPVDAATLDTCTGVTCNQPPINRCEDQSMLESYAPLGTCEDFVCSYDLTEVYCPFGCESGACNPDPCANVTCNAPPASTCVGNTAVIDYSAQGTCSAGTCTYTSTQTPCPAHCDAGACLPVPALTTVYCEEDASNTTGDSTGSYSGDLVDSGTISQPTFTFGDGVHRFTASVVAGVAFPFTVTVSIEEGATMVVTQKTGVLASYGEMVGVITTDSYGTFSFYCRAE